MADDSAAAARHEELISRTTWGLFRGLMTDGTLGEVGAAFC